MSNKLFLLLLITTFPLFLNAQNEAKVRKPHQLWLRSTDSPMVKRGYLHSLSDSSVTILNGWYVKPREKQEFQVAHIEWVKFRRQGKVLRGVGIGAAIGLATGMIWGLALNDNAPCKSTLLNPCFPITWVHKGIFISLISLPVGGLIGGLVGSKRTKITIDGRRSEYIRQRKLIESFRRY